MLIVGGYHGEAECVAELDPETQMITIVDGVMAGEDGHPPSYPGDSFLYGGGYEDPLDPNHRYWHLALEFTPGEFYVIGSDPNGKGADSKSVAG